MKNRREDYRHSFPLNALPPAECEFGAKVLRGEVMDLSVSGMKLRIENAFGQIFLGQSLLIKFKLPPDKFFSIKGRVVHGPYEDNPAMGIQFLPLAERTDTEDREKALWAFLLAEQWKLRRLGLAQLHG